MEIDKLYVYKKDGFLNFNNNIEDEYKIHSTFHYVVYNLNENEKNNYDIIYIKNFENRCEIKKNVKIDNYDFLFYSPKVINKYFIPINLLFNNNTFKLEKLHGRKGFTVIDTIFVYKDLYIDKNIIIHKNKENFNDNFKISIVMTTYNRVKQTLHTINIINKSEVKNIEIIIVDDASDPEKFLELKQEINKYDKVIKLIEIKNEYKNEKNYNNPCIPFNIGFNLIRGKITIIQNSECCYYGDLPLYVLKNINKINYLNFCCFSLSSEETQKLYSQKNYYKFIKNQTINKKARNKWYNHPKFRSKYYHFTSAITTKNLFKIGGFHEGFAYKIDYDDSEFIKKILYNNLKLSVVNFNKALPFVIHQHHEKYYLKRKISTNEKIYNEILKQNIYSNLYKYL